MKKLNITICLVICLATTMKSFPQSYKMVNGVFAWKSDARLKLVIRGGSFTYIDSRKGGDLAMPCCDTLTYGDISLDRSGFLLLKSDPSLNLIFIGMNVTERKNPGSDSIEFIIHNPIEDTYRKYNSGGGDLTYTLSVSPTGQGSDYFKDNMRPFQDSHIRFYNPQKVGVSSFAITIQPQCSVYVKNLVVREMSTDTYTVKDNSANVFEIFMPQLSYGFISYMRLDGDYAKILDKNSILWKGKEFVRANF